MSAEAADAPVGVGLLAERLAIITSVAALLVWYVIYTRGVVRELIAAGAKSVKEAQSYMSVLMLLPMLPTIILMVNPVKNQLWMLTVPFLAQNQMILKLVRSEAISMQEWAAYLAAGFGGPATAPAGSDSARGDRLLARHFPQTAANPTVIVLRLRQPAWAATRAVAAAERQLAADPVFTSVSGPLNANGTALTAAR